MSKPRRARHYHLVNSNLTNVTRRKERLTRIAANKRKRKLGLSSNDLVKTMSMGSWLGIQFYGRDGWPITHRAYIRHIEDPNYVCVASDWHRGIRVSTVWMGKRWPQFGGSDEYYLFETMCFWKGKDAGLQMRYTNESDARRGHAVVLAFIRKTWTGDPAMFRREDDSKRINIMSDETHKFFERFL